MMIDLTKYDGLIFDMDGTLIDTMPAHIQAWQQTANHFGFEFEASWLHSLGGMPSYKIAGEVNAKYGLSLNPKAVSAFKMDAFANIENKGDVISCTHDLLLEYYGKKRLAVGTGSQRKSAETLLAKTDILPKLDSLITATDVERHKPNPDTFLDACKGMGLSPEQCVVFEDTDLGKQAAHAANMDCIMVVEGKQLMFYPRPD
ncbi:beta-phosphoglucomutase family hydrolase [Vibrio sp. THAF190c]|uniref:beta-phosphoglucomutase family hydrolase n=1 Tax=Vibrio sp. THAF190c TaxID=2587865 RepID=UPI001267E0AD|nr:beta-phosphoglucomutase family hydrolase [Vibrio sp. THAF190c]QFT12755.1 Fructose-1-phosphate phosphatase YqaB [Vibrio sp. THAF190c]